MVRYPAPMDFRPFRNENIPFHFPKPHPIKAPFFFWTPSGIPLLCDVALFRSSSAKNLSGRYSLEPAFFGSHLEASAPERVYYRTSGFVFSYLRLPFFQVLQPPPPDWRFFRTTYFFSNLLSFPDPTSVNSQMSSFSRSISPSTFQGPVPFFPKRKSTVFFRPFCSISLLLFLRPPNRNSPFVSDCV